MKRKRLDSILLEKGLVSEAQIRQALLRQKARGGRLGSNLLFFRFITEEQLVSALAEQFGVAPLPFDCLEKPPPDALSRIPVEMAEEHLLFPILLDQGGRVLHLAVADPEDAGLLAAVKEFSGVNSLTLYVASEVTIRNLHSLHYRGKTPDPTAERIIDLPDLFAGEEPGPSSHRGPEAEAAVASPRSRALLLTDHAFLRTMLPAIFEREGWDLDVATSPDHAMEMIRQNSYKKILASEPLGRLFHNRVSSEAGGWPSPVPDMVILGQVSTSLFENRISFGRIIESLLRSVRNLAELRSPVKWNRPPYAPIERDVERLGRSVGLPSLAVDGLRILVHLLVPNPVMKEDIGHPGTFRLRRESFSDLQASLGLSVSLNFPWALPDCLDAFEQLLAGTLPPRDSVRGGAQSEVAAQVLALAWYRAIIRHARISPAGVETAIGEQAGLLAAPAIVETFINILAKEMLPPVDRSHRDVFVTAGMDRIAFPVVAELRLHGYRPVEVSEWSEVRHLFVRRRPSAILVNCDVHSGEAIEWFRTLKREGRTDVVAMFGFTTSADASLVTDLLETGFADVFNPPFIGSVIMARISKTLSVLAEKAVTIGAGGFRASFNEISFLDLIQALAWGGKNVLIEIEHPTGERAGLHLRAGQIVHASCGAIDGLEAVYRVIGWRDEGRFQIEPCTAFPVDNISVPNDYILMEGCRLLDEAQGAAPMPPV